MGIIHTSNTEQTEATAHDPYIHQGQSNIAVISISQVDMTIAVKAR